jgi:transposase
VIAPLVKCCAGLDVHRATVVCTILREDKRAKIHKETREYSSYREGLLELSRWLCSRKVELAVMESTSVYWKPVFEALEGKIAKLYLVNSRHVKNVPGRKTDVKDSEWLAELARCGLLRPSFIPPRDFREMRFLTRYLMKLSGYIASEKNRLHKTLDDCGIKLGCVVTNMGGLTAREIIDALIEGKMTPEEMANLARTHLRKKHEELRMSLHQDLSDRHRYLLLSIQNHLRWLENQRELIVCQVVTAMEPYRKEWELIQTIPGFDELSAAVLLVEVGIDMSCFRQSKRLTSWAGVCPGSYESAGKNKSGRTRKGNKYLRQILCEVSNSARKTESQFKHLYQGLVIRRGHNRAILAIGRKLLEIVFVILSRKEPYKDPKADYEKLLVMRNAPRWISKLRKYGYLPVYLEKKSACT